MIKTRLIQLLSHAKKYIVFQVIWKWLSLLCQVVMIYAIASLLEKALSGTMTQNHILIYGIMVLIAILIRFCCDRQASYSEVKRSGNNIILRLCLQKICRNDMQK